MGEPDDEVIWGRPDRNAARAPPEAMLTARSDLPHGFAPVRLRAAPLGVSAPGWK